MSEIALPPLREDLSLMPGPLHDGAPSWTLYDPARHRFVRLGWQDFEILSRWALRTPTAIRTAMRQETTLRPDEADVMRLAGFLRQSGLLRASSARDTQALAAAKTAARRSAASWLMHNYLFLRIRLVNPDRFLAATLPAVGWMFTRAYLFGLSAAAVLGLFLISRQWDLYTHSLVQMATPEGLLWMGAALSMTKAIHELGHGFAAKRYGCRVPAMGIAFLVLWPVLWTDTTDAWRLARRDQRLVIDAAGMLAEISVATLASFAWAVLPDGPARSAAFVLSSSTWILTLLINLSPLMRFDGYYLLSDALDIPNLQERGFAYGRWVLREALFRPGAPPPETFAPAMARILTVYAFAAWTYRFALFTGIAVLVYHLTFRALGLVLMGVELWFFVARPILSEMGVWASVARASRLNRHGVVSLLLLSIALAALLAPWRGRIDAPGLLRAERQATLYANEAGRLAAAPAQGKRLAAGEAAFTLVSPEVDHALKRASAELDAAEANLAVHSFDAERRRTQPVSLAAVSEAAASLSHAQARAAALEVRAPFAGVLTDIPPGIATGTDVRRLEPLGILIDPSGMVVEAYVAEADLPRLVVGARGRFVQPYGGSLPLRVTAIASASTRTLEPPELASVHGGAILVRRDAKGELAPEQAVYRVLLTVDDPAAPVRRETGHVAIEARTESFAGVLYRRVVAVLRRESSL